MHTAIVAMLILIVLILLGALLPAIYVIAAGIFAVAPAVLTVAGLFVGALVVLIIYHAWKGTL